jgi:hypothetical protein
LSEKPVIGQTAPSYEVSDWVQGEPTYLDQLLGRVVLLEIFQVNCPGCFLYGLPEAVDLHQRYFRQGLTVIGIATTFEDFDKNTLANLRLLAKREMPVTEEEVKVFAQEHIPNFSELTGGMQTATFEKIRLYLEKLEFRAVTFERYRLKGTPSQILIDKHGVLREVNFGLHPNLEDLVLKLLREDQ